MSGGSMRTTDGYSGNSIDTAVSMPTHMRHPVLEAEGDTGATIIGLEADERSRAAVVLDHDPVSMDAVRLGHRERFAGCITSRPTTPLRWSRRARNVEVEHRMTAASDTSSSRERRLVATFVELADTLVEDFDLVEFFSSLTGRVVQIEIASEAGILLVDEAGDLQFVAASHERTHLLELFQVQNEEGPCQDCFTTGLPVSVDDLEAAGDRWPLFAPRAVSAGFRSALAVPLRLRGAVLGAFNLFLNDAGGVDPESQAVVQAMADVATIGLLQQRELDRAHTVEAQLQQALQTRIDIEQAKGIISERIGIPMDAAFDMLRGYSRSHSQKLHDAARHIVGGTLAASDLT